MYSSDEEFCGDDQVNRPPCPVVAFYCDHGDCFDKSVLCNHNFDCIDFTDEMNCTYLTVSCVLSSFGYSNQGNL